ncbi:uncharacterized protein LOC110266746 [Arachis ipaensis]|uniref:uncharacterized protein LOC110266746 n=1 Tax=Arachis ipaensis TaxID=130454 RepID=UPI000A2B7140|nr:uncharacterized protein LOC110266746 [Arachis ipaensis]
MEKFRGDGFLLEIEGIKGPLGRWHKENFGDMDKKIAKFEEEIKKVDDMAGELSDVGVQGWSVERITEEESATLEVIPSAEEIKEAVWDCESSKAPDCDGYNMNFIKRCWGEIVADFMAAVVEFFQTSRLPADSNITWVALAPKFIGAKEIKDLRPISMVGCVYKVISKVLVRRMRAVMPKLVGETQSAFVKGRNIHDGALIACETVHWLKRRKKEAERGLRQGDPLSPFLFVLVVDVLHRMVGEAVRNGRILPLVVSRDSVELSHLQFADDTILFCPPEDETMKNYKRLLRWFELEDTLPVKYLGVPLGANPRLVKTWKPIIDKVEEKLSLWKAKVLSKAEKLVLIKSVLNSLLVYYLSLYKMPKAVAEKLISLQRRCYKKECYPRMSPATASRTLSGKGWFHQEWSCLLGVECLGSCLWPALVLSEGVEGPFSKLDRGTAWKRDLKAASEVLLCDHLAHLDGEE